MTIGGQCAVRNLHPLSGSEAFPSLTARENLGLLPRLSEERPPVEEMCERLGVHSLLEQPISTLSLGQRQRIALIRSLRKPFKWLLLKRTFQSSGST